MDPECKTVADGGELLCSMEAGALETCVVEERQVYSLLFLS